jgi:NADPH:quinone reductase-like Zn-dependent oxidoreductase
VRARDDQSIGRILLHQLNAEGLVAVGLTRSQTSAERLGKEIQNISSFSSDQPHWQDRLQSSLAGRPLVAVADCVSGTLVRDLLPLLADDAAILTYGALDRSPIGVTGLDVTDQQFTIRGVVFFRWFFEVSAPEQREDIAAAIRLAQSHPELFAVADTFGLDQIQQAIAAVERPGRKGFVLLKTGKQVS